MACRSTTRETGSGTSAARTAHGVSLGELSAGQRSALEQHIAECTTCCQTLRDIPDDALTIRLRNVQAPALPAAGPGDVSGRTTTLPRELRDHPRYKVRRFLGSGGMGAVY